jgi:hypothetical protein
MSRILALTLLAGCNLVGGATTPFTEVPALPDQRGCSDVYVYATSEDGAVTLRFQVSGTLEAAYDGTASQQWSADDAAIDLALEQGRNLDQEGCTDVVDFENGEPVVQVDTTWLPTSGTVSLDLTPTGDVFNECDAPADAVLTLDSVVFESPDGDEVTVDHLEVSAGVGWCPG